MGKMHEMALVRSVVDIVVDTARSDDVGKVSAVHVCVGEGRDVVEDLFEGLFQYLARGTVAEDADLILYRIPFMVHCNECGFTFHIIATDRDTWRCPKCGAYQKYKLVSGLEFYVSKIEVVDDSLGFPRKGEGVPGREKISDRIVA